MVSHQRASSTKGLHLPVWVIDAGWALMVGIALTIAIRVAREPGARAPDLVAYALGWTIAVLLLVRRRWPLAVLGASFVVLQVYYALDYPGISAALALAVALYTVAAAGHIRWALAVTGWFVVGPIIFRLFVDRVPLVLVLGEMVREASLWLATLLLGDVVRSRRALSQAYRLLEIEQDRSESLLRNMLPDPIAQRLKQRQDVIADAFPHVTVLFADIVDFTEHTERGSPGETVEMLNELFSQFDAMTESRGLEKIKTIGDAYMVAGGLPSPMVDHAVAVAELALQMLEVTDAFRLPDGASVRLRVGVDSGPVAAGVIGRRKFSYDLWGDTVNTASRMESTGVPGRIQVTERTRQLLGERYVFRERGSIQVKGKGAMHTFFLLRRADGTPPNRTRRSPGSVPFPALDRPTRAG
jgi:adenylate cyclase